VKSGVFHTPLRVEKVDARNWRLTDDLVYVTSWGWPITVPKGFVTDFASTPRPIWWLMPPSDEYDAAAVVHDWFYRNHFTRWLCDGLFYEAGNALLVPFWKIWTMYFFLRLFGWWAWRREPAGVWSQLPSNNP
jgi:hypothetical protein